MTNSKLTLIFGLLLPLGLLHAQSGENLYDPSYVHEVRFYFFEDDFWDSLEYNYHEFIDDSGTDVPYTKAFVQIDGAWLDTVGIRQKGLSSNNWSTEFKKPFKVDLNEFVQGQKFDGIKKFNLHNGACDPSMMRDFVAYNVHRTAGVRAPRMSYCKLYFNDEYWGLYGIIEQIDKTFVEDHFSDDGGTLIKNIGWSELQWEGPEIDPYLVDFQLKTNEEEEDWSNFLQFLNVVNNSSDEEFSAAIKEIFDVDLFLHVLAVDIMTNNWDSYIQNRRNWYLYHEPAGGKLHWIPWDYNLSMGGDFDYHQNPFPPYDPDCQIQANFDYVRNVDGSYSFIDRTYPAAQFWEWDFGGAQSSTGSSPTFDFNGEEKVQVCLTSRRFQGADLCENTRCRTIKTTFNPSDCATIQNGTSPYPSSDPIFQLVVQQDDFCCEDEWDAFCTLQYVEIADAQLDSIGSPGIDDYDYDFPLILDNPDKILVDRLMQVEEFRERYLDISCFLLANNFTEERLFPLIDQQASLIRGAIDEDPNYVYSHDHVEYDLGDGTGGGDGVDIPPIKWLLANRFAQMQEDLAELGHDCSSAFSPVGWQDITINEFMASNDENSGITDQDGETEDWIELYNNSSQLVDLTNFYLSDDHDQPLKWNFPFGSFIEPGGYLIVWADKDEDQNGLHANFKLSKSGESIIFRHEDGTIIDSLSFGEQTTNVSSARRPNGVGDFYQQSQTFMANNELFSSISAGEEETEIVVYPNPAQDYLMVEWKEAQSNEKYELRLIDMLGISLRQVAAANKTKWEIDVAELPAGLYIVEIGNDTQKWQKKIMID